MSDFDKESTFVLGLIPVLASEKQTFKLPSFRDAFASGSRISIDRIPNRAIRIQCSDAQTGEMLDFGKKRVNFLKYNLFVWLADSF